jgi:hypothetical protein
LLEERLDVLGQTKVGEEVRHGEGLREGGREGGRKDKDKR